VKAACQSAVEALVAIVGNQAASDSARVRAAQVILDVALRIHEVEDVERRLAQLERRLEERHAA
jgi:hypothetical protein